ncbi:phosphocholine-specific phospholipase C [Aquirhabdus sp.]|uniref:phosphocholine-specific phospholipase C n=1 Tax=Aquirhabdus sp. TaxID=2824160 RepID=UPI00396CFBB0
MTKPQDINRRLFLKHSAQLATLAGAAGLLPETIQRALAIAPNVRTGTIQDVEHVVILMQENRSFDHYFGNLNGVRGFNDPRVLKRQDGKPVWYQYYNNNDYSPYHWDTKVTYAQWEASNYHDWSPYHGVWNEGRNDKWMTIQYPTAMGYFKRSDISYYYAMADAFTLCEAYHQSMLGPTNTNRLYHMTGRAAPTGDGTGVNTTNSMGDGTIGVSGTVDWMTYPERLSAAGINWKIYQEGGYQSSSLWSLYINPFSKYTIQEKNNYDCNALAWFKNFKNAGTSSDLWQRAMVARGVDKLRTDVLNNQLPQVSWLISPYCYSEHPWWGPSFGEYYVSKILEALTSNPEVWAKTVFIINYDEGDGFYDHVSAAVPPWKAGTGLSTVSTVGEIEQSSQLPIGLGYRVPLLAISPWSKGGKVSAEVFDHTSVLRFLEKRFGVIESNISPWRRAVCGDLTSLFDFTGQGNPAVESALTNVAQTNTQMLDAYNKQYYYKNPDYWSYPPTGLPGQEFGQRDALAVPYELYADVVITKATNKLVLLLTNNGKALPGNPDGKSAAVFQVHATNGSTPRFYTVTSYLVTQSDGSTLGKTISDDLSALVDASGNYSFQVRGPNGFYREFVGNINAGIQSAEPVISLVYKADGNIYLSIKNNGALPCRVTVQTNSTYSSEAAHSYDIGVGSTIQDLWNVQGSQGWYDLSATATNTSANFLRRLAGHVETGALSKTDPLLNINQV